MRQLTLTYLILAAIALAGCSRTIALYPANPEHFEKIPGANMDRVELVNGIGFQISNVRVEGDSLVLFPATVAQDSLTVHRSQIQSLSRSEVAQDQVAYTVVLLFGAFLIIAAIWKAPDWNWFDDSE